MYLYSSNAFNEAILKNGRTFKARLSCGEEIIDSGFISIKTSGGSNNADTITIGSTISQRIEVEMFEQDIPLSDKEWFLEMGLLVKNEYEYVPIGYFTPEKPLTENGKTTFTAYDRMMKLSETYYCTLGNVNTVTVLDDISEKTGVPIDTEELTAIPMSVPKDYTYREVLMYISQLYGKFANVSRKGVIELHWWGETGEYTLTADNTIGFQHDETEYVLGYLSVSSKDSEGNTLLLLSGNGQQGISIENPFMTEETANSAFAEISGFTYTVSNTKCPLADIRMDPWDIINVTDIKGNTYKMPLMTMEFNYDGGLSANFSCVGNSKTEEENDYKGPMRTLQEKMEAKVEGLRGAVSVIQQTAGQVLVINSDEMGTLSSVINTETWEVKYVDANGEEVSGLKFDPTEKKFVFNADLKAGSININDKFVVDSEGNTQIAGGKFYALNSDGTGGDFFEVAEYGLGVYKKNALIPILQISKGETDDGRVFPSVILGATDPELDTIGFPCMIKRFADGLWIGNIWVTNDYEGNLETEEKSNGIFISITDNTTYAVAGNDKKNFYTGDTIARFA